MNVTIYSNQDEDNLSNQLRGELFNLTSKFFLISTSAQST